MADCLLSGAQLDVGDSEMLPAEAPVLWLSGALSAFLCESLAPVICYHAGAARTDQWCRVTAWSPVFHQHLNVIW